MKSKYLNVTHLAELTDLNKKTVRKKIDEMKASGVYPDTVFFVGPLRVEVEAFLHFNAYEDEIKRGIYYPEWR